MKNKEGKGTTTEKKENKETRKPRVRKEKYE